MTPTRLRAFLQKAKGRRLGRHGAAWVCDPTKGSPLNLVLEDGGVETKSVATSLGVG